tara:strand:- start:1981 stop:2403 length:423 start_codon:yes stop_codon:yes gene_type:complete
MKKSDLTEFGIEEDSFKLQIKRDNGQGAQPQIVSYAPAPAVPAQALTVAPVESLAPAADATDTGIYITSPMVGTFYTAASPESAPFTKVGDVVKNDSVVCIIEAMKIMNEIQAEQAGTVAEILVEDGQAVEFGQRLIRLS